jgi:hypothetical protein
VSFALDSYLKHLFDVTMKAMMEDPDPDLLLPFLVPAAPTPIPPKSAPSTASPLLQPPDLRPSSPDLLVDVSHVEAHPGTKEIEAVEDRVHGGEKSLAPPP